MPRSKVRIRRKNSKSYHKKVRREQLRDMRRMSAMYEIGKAKKLGRIKINEKDVFVWRL